MTAIGLLAIVVGLVVWFNAQEAMRKEANRMEVITLREGAIRKSLSDYHLGLQRLKEDPTNPDLRQDVLHLGRTYSNLTRDRSGVTVYDEVALKNDIDAACAGTVTVQKQSIDERLGRLKALFADGHIDEREYLRRRRSIIDET